MGFVNSKVSSAFLVFLIIFCLPAFGQKKTGESAATTYDIRNPGKDIGKYCMECARIFQYMPNEVQYGVVCQDNVILFAITDIDWFNKIFTDRNDGIAIDIITKDMYPCKKDNKKRSSWASHGRLLKPVYLKEMTSNMFTNPDGVVYVPVGTVPDDVDPENAEFNALILKNKYVCAYRSFYEIQGQKWGLLEMGLYMDTLDQQNIKDKSVLLNKRLKFEIPFEKNKTTYDPKDIKPLYDSLNLNDFNIVSTSIRAYSSIEGPEAINIELQEKRAESIVKALQSFQNPTIKKDITASENWVEFLEDVGTTKYSVLKTLSKEEIKKTLEDKKVSLELEPILKKERKAVVQLMLEKKVRVMDNDSTKIKKLFEQSIAQKNIEEAMEIQQVIFEKIGHNELPASFLNKLEIPQKVEYGQLLNNNAAFNFMLNESDVYGAIRQYEKLQDILPKSIEVKYNLCVLRLKAWVFGDLAIDPLKLRNDIAALEKLKIDKRLVKRMLINYSIINCEYLMKQKKYADKDKALKYIHDNYATLNLSDKDVLNLAEYFTGYTKYEWAEALLNQYVRKVDVDENILFYYINLTISKAKITEKPEYRTIMLNAYNINKSRYCTIFSSPRKGGISFQLLDNGYLKKTYCENCRDR